MRPGIARMALALALVAPFSMVANHPQRASAQSNVPHVLVVVEENREYGSVIGNPAAPYVNTLASQYGLATASYGQSHPSLPNYLEMLSGSTWGIADDGTGYVLPGPTFVDQLTGRGIGWRAYIQDMPSPCYAGASYAGYAKKHDPFMYFTSITQTAQCANVVPYTQAGADLAGGTAPPFLWVTPNLCNDGHDCSTATMDSWLSGSLPAFLNSAWFQQGGVAIVTWDEGSSGAGCCGGAHGGHIATIVIPSSGAQHIVDGQAVSHAGLLGTLEDFYGVGRLRDATCSCSGSLVQLQPQPSASFSAYPPTETNVDFNVQWTLDHGSAPAGGFQIFVAFSGGPWMPWTNETGDTTVPFTGEQGVQYSFGVVALRYGEPPGRLPASVGAVIAVSSNAVRTEPFTSMYGVDGVGVLHGGSSPPQYQSAPFTWDIARGVALDTTGAGGFVLDGWGGVHRFGDATGLNGTAYWPGWDIVRGVSVTSNAGYVLDGWGGLHPVSMNGAPLPAPPASYAWYFAWDVMRGVARFADGTGGVTLDAFGGVHVFTVAADTQPADPITTYPYWPGWAIARAIVLSPGSTYTRCSGYVLDGWGGLHAFASQHATIPPLITVSGYWPGWDVARAVMLLPGSQSSGYTLDGLGGFHAFGSAPPVTTPNYGSVAALHGAAIS